MKRIITMAGIFLLALHTSAAKAQTHTAVDSLKQVTVKVSNLHCNNDMPTIKKRLLNQDGIEEVSFTEIEGSTAIFTISYHTSATNQEQIEKAIESTPGCDAPDETPYKIKRSKKKRS